MMIRVNGEYLDFDDDIEIESQIKLFDEISTSNGDYSYSFDLSKTSKNLAALGLPFPDTIKSIYQNVRCELIDDSGFKIHTGGLQVNRITDTIQCTFFGGNNDWFGLLSDPISSLPLYKYDINLTAANIQASWTKTQGLVFPIMDTGALVTRSFQNLKIEDFSAGIYVKSLFKDIFGPLGIKVKGDLINDPNFNQLIVCANGKSQDDVDDRSCYVEKTTAQNNITTLTKVTFQNESVFPFFDGSIGNFNNSTFTADVKMIVSVSISIVIDLDPATNATIYFYKNGASFFSYVAGINVLGGVDRITTIRTLNMSLEMGDTLEIYADEIAGLGGNIDLISGTIRVTPTYIYRVFGKSSVPNWTKGKLVSNIIRNFNVLPSFNADSKTLTLDLFNKIKEKQAVDISDQITINEIDFSEFVSHYGKNNSFKYQESDDEDLREYNISNFISYGSGNLTVDNDFIDNSADVLESDFTSPITYLNGVFDMSMERFNFVELDEILNRPITSIDDPGSGRAAIKITNANTYFSVGDLVRIECPDNDVYNGDWVIDATASGSITVNGLFYESGAFTGTATLLRHKFTSDSNVYLFLNAPNLNNLFFSSNATIYLDSATTFTSTAIAYFNILSNGREINTKFKQSLSFGTVNNLLSYQKTMLDTYWPIFSAILNDPVMLRVSAYFNKKTYTELKSFLRPLRIKTNETNNLYYLNKITGYKSSHEVCEGELIKL